MPELPDPLGLLQGFEKLKLNPNDEKGMRLTVMDFAVLGVSLAAGFTGAIVGALISFFGEKFVSEMMKEKKAE